MSVAAPPERVKRKGINLRVKGHGPGFLFGKEPHGKVLPVWLAELCGRSAEQLVTDGDMEWTDEEAVGEWKAPTPKNEVDRSASEAMSEELDRIRRQNFELTGLNRQLDSENKDLRHSKEQLIVQLGEQSAQIAHWRETSDGYRTHLETVQAAYEEQEKTCQSQDNKIKELEDRLAAILKVPAPGKGKVKEAAPVG